MSRYQKGKTNLDFTEARDSEWQWHQLGHVQVQTDSHANTTPLSFLQAGCPSCRPTNSVKALIEEYHSNRVLGGGFNLPGKGVVFWVGVSPAANVRENVCHNSKKRKKSCFGDFEKNAKNVLTFSEAT